MARDIYVDQEELARFIEVLAAFQEITTDKFKAVLSDWQKCDESWEGESKDQFSRQFLQTQQAVEDALEAGGDALKWLTRFDEIVQEFERGYR